MVRIKLVDYRGITGIMTDGYLPNFSYFQEKDWTKTMEEKMPLDPSFKYDFERNIHNKYLKPDKGEPSDKTRSFIHNKIAISTRKRFCPHEQKYCVQFNYPARGTKQIERIISMEKKKVREKILPAFSREIAKAQSNGETNYFFNLVFMDARKGRGCPAFEDCSANWQEVMGFKVKEEKDYENFDEYRNAADALLKRYIDFGIEAGWFGRESPG
jgi:hypothetical protein